MILVPGGMKSGKSCLASRRTQERENLGGAAYPGKAGAGGEEDLILFSHGGPLRTIFMRAMQWNLPVDAC